MSLPQRCQNTKKYFRSALKFLNEYSWIYKTSNTRFIKENTLENIPHEWIEYFLSTSLDEFNSFPCTYQLTFPTSLKIFHYWLQDLKPNFRTLSNAEVFNELKLKEINFKKQHEISRLSKTIIDFCNDQINIIIDFGSGLGYLSQVLFEQKNFYILGLELSEKHNQGAIKRQKKYYPSSVGRVFFVQHRITDESKNFILEKIHELFPTVSSPRVAIVGLHTCADLVVNAINLFQQSKFFQKLICMPCCYHKLEISENSNNSSFKRFPISKELINVFKGNKNIINANCINRPFLRLACQETASRWQKMNETDHKIRGREMFLRGIAECLINEDEECIVKTKNKLKSNQKLSDSTIDFNAIEENYKITSKVNGNTIKWNNHHREEFLKILLRYPNGEKLAEILTCLQTSIQELCENLVLLDRLCYMRNFSKRTNTPIDCKILKILDESISPRCFAILASYI